MGMAAHAMITRDDGAVFVHLHPAGTISVTAQETFLVRQPGDTVRGELGKRLATMAMGGGERGAVASGEVSFAYAFSQSGRYRLWIQVRHNHRIQTGVFDAEVSSARLRGLSGTGWRTEPSGAFAATSIESMSHMTTVMRSRAAAKVSRSSADRPRSLRARPSGPAR